MAVRAGAAAGALPARGLKAAAVRFGLFMMPLHPPHRAFADAYDRDVAQIGTLLSITTDCDDAGWDHESLRLLAEQVGPRIAHLAGG